MTPTEQTSTAHGSGNSVNVTLGGQGIWVIAALMVAMIVVLSVTIPISIRAEQKAQEALDTAARVQRQADLSNWTLVNLEGLLQAHNIAVPVEFQPHNLIKSKEK